MANKVVKSVDYPYTGVKGTTCKAAPKAPNLSSICQTYQYNLGEMKMS